VIGCCRRRGDEARERRETAHRGDHSPVFAAA
jgi:hypothetical protein